MSLHDNAFSQPARGGAMSTQDPATAPSGIGPGWFPAIRAADVAAGPVAVRAGTRRYVAFRPEPGGPISVLSARCPHHLVDLAHADVVQGRLRCPYHGWQFDPDGNCAQVPSNGPDAGVPPRADLDRPWRVRELGGVVWVAPVDPSLASDHSEHVDHRATEEILTNLDPALEAAWHPLALSDEVPLPGATPMSARLLGRTWRGCPAPATQP